MFSTSLGVSASVSSPQTAVHALGSHGAECHGSVAVLQKASGHREGPGLGGCRLLPEYDHTCTAFSQILL